MLREKAYAKINLFLNVTKKRADGYHDLEMVMAPLKLHDILTFKKAENKEITIKSNVPITTDIKDNVVYKIASFLQEEFQVEKGVEIYIDKKIPMGGGLAGGSADAAATLRGLNRLWRLKLDKDDMAKLGVQFGADIPFCVYNKMALVKGIGEQITFIKHRFKPHVLIVNPNIEVSTKDVFTNFKEEYIQEKSIHNIIDGIKSKELSIVANEMYNSLEQVTFDLYPEVKELKNDLKNSKLEATMMSGSGSTVFSLSNNLEKIKNAQNQVKSTYFNVVTRIHK